VSVPAELPRPLRRVPGRAVPVPIDDGGDTTAPQPPQLHHAARHGILGDWLELVDPYTEAHPAALLVTALVGFGNLYGPRAWATVGATRHYARLFALIVGPTSKGAKGDAKNEGKRLLVDVDPDWAHEQITEGLSSGEGLIARVADPDPMGPYADTVVDKRLLLIETEFARVLAQGRRDGNTIGSVIRQAWDDYGDLNVMTRHDPLKAKGTHITILGHSTPTELKAKVDSVDVANGLLNRFLWVWSERTKLLPRPPARDDEWQRAHRDVANALARAASVARGELDFDPDAERLWVELYHELAAQSDRAGDSIAGALCARDRAYVLRLALVYALVDTAPAIRRPHLEAAWAVWQYSRATIEWVWGGVLSADAERLLAEVKGRKADGLTAAHQSALFGHHRTAAQLAAMRAELVDAGELVVARQAGSKGRAPVMLWATSHAPQWALAAAPKGDHAQ
jgi:hypothetical protein